MRYLKQSFCPKALPINHRMVPCLLWVCLILIVLPSLSKGQDWIGPTPMDYANMNMNFTNTLIMNGVIQRQVEERNGISTTTTSKKVVKKSTVSAGTTSTANFAYTATPTQRNAYRDAYIDRLAKTDSTLAASLRTQLNKYDYNTIYTGLLSGTGLVSDNLADALTAYIVMGWMIVNGVSTDPPATHIAAVRQQCANALNGSVYMQDTNKRRQTAEELKIKMVLLNAGWRDAQKLKQSTAYASAIDGGFQSQMKLQLHGLALSTAGLVAK